MKVYCCYTPAHEPLFRDHFLPSIPNDVEVIGYNMEISGAGDFLSKEFLDCISRKMQLVRASLDDSLFDIIVWADVDIIFFESFREELLNFMIHGGYDIAFQREGYGKWEKEVNTGFIVMRTNYAVRKFYDTVQATLAANPDKNEQPVINELLETYEGLKWAYLPMTYAARSHAWPPQQDLKLYHANVTGGEGGVQKKIEQFREVREQRGIKRRNVCVVSPEVIGPRRNSGIGTHTYHLLQELAKDPEVNLSFLLTAEITVEREGGWETWFRETLNTEFVALWPQPHRYAWVGWFNQWFNLRSLQVYQYLRTHNHEIVYFQDLNGDGFVSHQARRTGIAFQKAVFTTTINGPARWAREGMKQFAAEEVDESLLNHAEGYALANSDIVIAPSQYAFDYAENGAGWQLAENRRICPYMLDLPDFSENPPATEPAGIIFFGRLETRKGIHYFLGALEVLQRRGETGVPRRVVFIGNHGITQAGSSADLIPRFFEERLPGWSFETHSEWGQPECIDYLSRHRDSVIVLPSIAETLGYVAIECIGLGLNVIGANTGAFPEVFADPGRLFENRPAAIADKIIEAFAGALPAPRSLYSAADAAQRWRAVIAETNELQRARVDAIPRVAPDLPWITICIPYFNYGRYIRDQIDSLWIQSHQRYIVIMIDDGSTDPASIEEFDKMREELTRDGRFRFVRQENMGLSKTRNRAAAMAETEYIVFCDADNISKPFMLERLLRGIMTSGADCVTCHFEKFRMEPNGHRLTLDHYTPVGGCIEAGPFVDPFGDANCIIRKAVFEKIGGFRHVPMTASEDWEFFAELCLSGYRLEVLPDDLFLYREHAESNMRTTSFYDSRMRTLHPYLRRLEGWQRRLLTNAVGAYEMKIHERRVAAEHAAAAAAAKAAAEAAMQIAYEKSFRGRLKKLMGRINGNQSREGAVSGE